MNYGLFGKFTAHAGKQEELAAILVEAAHLLEKTNPDCLQYVVGVTQGADDVWVSEVWTTKEAHDDSLAPEEVRSLIMRARPLIHEIAKGTEYAVVGGKVA